MFRKKSVLFLACLVMVPAMKAHQYEAIAQENLKSLANLKDDSALEAARIRELKEHKGVSAGLAASIEKQLNPSKQEKRRQVFSLLSEYEKEHKTSCASSVVDQTTIQDLELLSGPKSNPELFVAGVVDRAVTDFGRVALYRKLVHPLEAVPALQNQQEIVKELVRNKKLSQELNDQLKDLVVPENALLSFWDKDDLFSSTLVKVPGEEQIPAIKELSNRIHTNTVATAVTDKAIYAPLLPHALVVGTGVAGAGLGLWKLHNRMGIRNGFRQGRLFLRDHRDEVDRGIVQAREFLVRQWNEMPSFTKAVVVIYPAVLAVALGVPVYQAYRAWKDRQIMRNACYMKMSKIATYVGHAKQMVATATANQVLVARMPQLKKFDQYLDEVSRKSGELHKLLKLLETGSLNQGQDASTFFTFWPRIRVAYALMLDLKKDMMEIMITVGEIDAQLSIAKLYKEGETGPVKYCFPTYLVGCTTPSLSAQECWNPMVDRTKVVANSISLGDATGDARNVIITGPNAGGKSTITKSFIIAVIMAQSLGIVPAQEFSLTPFNHIATYLNITDDIAAGKSHFKAGVLRAKELMDLVKNNVDTLTLTAVDEAFNGTAPKEGQAAAYSLIKCLGKSEQNMCITNTHFPLVTKLEQEGGSFANYKVSVVYDEQGKFTCPYKLERGIANQNVAVDILRNEGFGEEFLGDMQQVLHRQKH